MCRKCLNNPDSFCYICGEFTLKKERRNLTTHVKKLYQLYSGCKVGDQDKSWAPHICCKKCTCYLSRWINGTLPALSLEVPMVLREQLDHVNDCYFCTTKVEGYNGKSKSCISHPNLLSAIRPASVAYHGDSLNSL